MSYNTTTLFSVAIKPLYLPWVMMPLASDSSLKMVKLTSSFEPKSASVATKFRIAVPIARLSDRVKLLKLGWKTGTLSLMSDTRIETCMKISTRHT